MEIRPPTWHLGPHDVTELLDLVADVATASVPPLSDQSRLALSAGATEAAGSVAVVRLFETGRLTAFVQLSPSSSGWTLDVVARAAPIDAALLDQLVASMLDVLADAGHVSGGVTWWRDGRVGAPAGFELDRELLQMRRVLPVDEDVTIVTRSFVPGVDEEAFVEVNNRAFVDHHEQSGWTPEMVVLREREPWFDPDGFRLHEVDSRLAGFCWTKVHPADAHRPADAGAIGEIYVIAVDPDFTGQGLGKQLTLAGLDHLARTGLTTAMLYVDADNVSAVAMYRRLGFGVHSSTKAYTRRLAESARPAANTSEGTPTP